MGKDRCSNLAEVRAKIDRIDRDIVDHMAERKVCVSLAARFKSRREEVTDPERIAEVVAAARVRARELELDPDIAEQAFRAMINGFIDFEYREFDRLHGVEV